MFSLKIPSLDNTWGAAFVGMIVASILYGITTLQTYIYYTYYPKDRRVLKLMVALLWLLDTLSLLLICHGIYTYLVTNYANPLILLKEIWSITVDPLLGGLVALLAHGYLGMRAWKVCNKNIFLGIGLIILSIVCFSFSIAEAAVVVALGFKFWTNTPDLKWLAIASTSLTIVVEGVIALVLCIYLHKHKTGGAGTRRAIHRIMVYTVNTGLVASVMSILNLIVYLALPDTLIFLAFNFIVTKVYANALLANLNIRRRVQDGSLEESGTLSLHVSMPQSGNALSNLVFDKPAASAVESLGSSGHSSF